MLPPPLHRAAVKSDFYFEKILRSQSISSREDPLLVVSAIPQPDQFLTIVIISFVRIGRELFCYFLEVRGHPLSRKCIDRIPHYFQVPPTVKLKERDALKFNFFEATRIFEECSQEAEVVVNNRTHHFRD